MRLAFLPACIVLAGVAAAQGSPAASAPPAVSYSSASELNQLLLQLQQSAQSMQVNLASLRIEKWKTDANTKQSTANDVESLQRNLKDALPEITGRLRGSPEDLATTFELYRNLDALYDVFSSVVESAGAFGTRSEYQTLQNDLRSLETERHAFADRTEKLATAKEGEITNLRTQLQKAQAAQEAAPPKRVVVDDTEVPKPPAKKKSAAKKPKPAPQPTDGNQPTNQQPSQSANPPANP